MLVDTCFAAELLATFLKDFLLWVQGSVALGALGKLSKAIATVPVRNLIWCSITEFYFFATGIYTCNFRDLFHDFVNFGLTLKI
jgi:hypothetical protein